MAGTEVWGDEQGGVFCFVFFWGGGVVNTEIYPLNVGLDEAL